MPTKILIIRFSSIGDIVLTTPVIRCIKTQLQDAEIHYLTKNDYTEILQQNPYISKVYSIQKSVYEVTHLLRREKYNFIVDLHNNFRSLQTKLALFPSPSKAFNKLNIQKWIYVNFKINLLPKLHVVDRYLKTVEKLGVVNDNKGLDYFIPAKHDIDIKTLPETHRNGYIAFVIGAKYYTKQLTAEKIISICKKINAPIILLGGNQEKAKGEEIKNAVGQLIFNACGLYSLNQSASIIKQATKVISHDTGLMHIAAALKKDIVSVWGNTVPEFGMYPYLPGKNSKTIEVKNLHCRPCSKIGYNSCPKKHFKCIDLIDEMSIIN